MAHLVCSAALGTLLVLSVGCSFVPPEAPETLAETGLYSDSAETLADGVVAFEPRWALWSDTASKNRWFQLPAGEMIDTSDPDGWVFPVGTKAWKEFTRDEVRVETRLLEKVGPGDYDGEWRMVAYLWNDDQTAAVAQPEGLEDASGTDHDLPDDDGCNTCHSGAADVLLGISALQLDHAGDGVTLGSLTDAGRLSAPISDPPDLPGDADAQAALGYLHANCGNCHGPRNTLLPVRFWLTLDALGTVAETPAYVTGVDVGSVKTRPLENTRAVVIIAPGDPDGSLVWVRTQRRSPEVGTMPPIGSERLDPAADVLADWITSL
jgi:hypothetical protein